MKTLLTGSVLATLLSGAPTLQIGDVPPLEMQLQVDEVLSEKVRVFDYHGNLLQEMKVEDVANDDISISEYFILENSHFAFDYLGDHYYLKD